MPRTSRRSTAPKWRHSARFPGLGAEVARLCADLADELPELPEVPLAARRGDEPTVRAKDASELAEREIEIGARGRASRPRRHSRRCRRRRADPGRLRRSSPPAGRGQLDHPLRLVDSDHPGSELLRHALGELAPAATDLQHQLRARTRRPPRRRPSYGSGPVAEDWTAIRAASPVSSAYSRATRSGSFSGGVIISSPRRSPAAGAPRAARRARARRARRRRARQTV